LNNLIKLTFISIALCCFSSFAIGQKITKVKGVVKDAVTQEGLPFVNVYFQGTQIGASTDLDGFYEIETRFPSDSLEVTYLGYVTLAKAVFKESKQEIDFALNSTSLQMETVTVTEKKTKYSKKNNPAVELIKKVLANRKENRLKGQDYYSYDKYEKIEMDANNITSQFRERRVFNQFQFLFDYVDTSEINGKPYLPIFLRETLSTVYYRKNPNTEKEIKHAVKLTNLSETIDDETIDGILDVLYENVDIYEDKLLLLGNEFIGPVSNRAINFYRFYIQDTVKVDDLSLIKLAFIPRNKLDMGFTGHLYISNDDKYFIKKADLGIIGGINLNFVRDLKIIQEFKELNGAYVLNKDLITIDYALTQNGIGAYGTRINNYKDYSFDPPEDPEVFSGIEKVKYDEGVYERREDYWKENRFEPLSKTEAGVYKMMDSLNTNPTFKRYKYIGYVIASGYLPYKGIEVGPIPTFVSFNPVEGARYKFGGETNLRFAKKIKLGGYGAYGTRDKNWKYSGNITYSFNQDFRENPRHFILLDYTKEVTFPGIQLDNIKTDNILLSIRRGIADRMLLDRSYKGEYTREGEVFSYSLLAERSSKSPIGNLEMPFTDNDGQRQFLSEINTFEVGVNLRYAPNEKFVQGRSYRTTIPSRFPIINLQYRAGINDALGGQYDYHKLSLGMSKKFYLGILGQTRSELELGKTFGRLPYLLYYIPRANQTYSYQIRSFNMMNFMEFVADEYVNLNIQHFFLGAIFNEIPLLKKLKLREIVTMKFLYGRLTDDNNPNLPANEDLIQFQNTSTPLLSQPLTYTLNSEPYIEGSFGVSNIFKFLRVDLVKRFTYLDNPNVPNLFGVSGLGLRFRFKVEF
jgi:hypothetical protein